MPCRSHKTWHPTPSQYTDTGPTCRCGIHWCGMSHWNTQLAIFLSWVKPNWRSWRGAAVVYWTATWRPGFDSRWVRCISRASRPSQGTVNRGAISKWPRCWWDVKHNQPTNQPTNQNPTRKSLSDLPHTAANAELYAVVVVVSPKLGRKRGHLFMLDSAFHHARLFCSVVVKVRGPFVQTLCIEKDSFMGAI